MKLYAIVLLLSVCTGAIHAKAFSTVSNVNTNYNNNFVSANAQALASVLNQILNQLNISNTLGSAPGSGKPASSTGSGGLPQAPLVSSSGHGGSDISNVNQNWNSNTDVASATSLDFVTNILLNAIDIANLQAGKKAPSASTTPSKPSGTPSKLESDKKHPGVGSVTNFNSNFNSNYDFASAFSEVIDTNLISNLINIINQQAATTTRKPTTTTRKPTTTKRTKPTTSKHRPGSSVNLWSADIRPKDAEDDIADLMPQPVEDTPEVQQAKEDFFQSYAEAMDRARKADYY